MPYQRRRRSTVSAEAPGRSEAAGPPPLVRLLQEFTLEANRYVDSAGGRNDMHRTDLNALAAVMRHTANGDVVTPGTLRKELNLSSPAFTAQELETAARFMDAMITATVAASQEASGAP